MMATAMIPLSFIHNCCNKLHRTVKMVKLCPVTDLIEELHSGIEDKGLLQTKVCFASSESGPWTEVEDFSMTLDTLISFGWKFVKVDCVKGADAESAAGEGSLPKTTEIRGKSAFDMLMLRAHCVPKKRVKSSRVKEGLTGFDELYNDVISLFQTKNWTFEKSTVEEVGGYIVQIISNALWYITNQHAVFEDASHRRRDLLPVPEIWSKFQGYNDIKRKKMKEQPMSAQLLKRHAEILHSILMKPIMDSNRMKGLKCGIVDLADCCKKYAEYLQEQLESAKKNQSLLQPVRLLSDNVSIETRKTAFQIAEKYQILDQALKNTALHQPLLFDESVHLGESFSSNTQRFRFLRDLHLSMSVDVLKYSPGSSHITVVYISRVDENRTVEEEKQQALSFHEKVRDNLPQFHTRQMKRQFKQQFAGISRITPSMLETVYQQLTLDASVASNPVVTERIRLIFLGETGLVQDMRSLSTGRPSDTFNTFFEKLGEIINEVTAEDDRRHGIAHVAPWVSMQDLIDQAKQRCPEKTAIPSKSLVRLQFTPRNPYSHAALAFTSKFDVQFKIQRRQLRAFHPDQHFAAAQLKYLKHFAVDHRNDSILIFSDDKAKVLFGEPDHLISTGVRGKKSLLPSSSQLSAEDHDVHRKGSLTPSVYLECDIPAHPSGSFYRGNVTVVLNDTIFQSSNPTRHAASMKSIIEEKTTKPRIIIKFSDGGTDQRPSLERVKCSLIYLFKTLDLDMLIAARCAPGQSWINPAERVMSILNIALQNCALARSKCEEKIEKEIARMTVNQMREKGNQDTSIISSWESSIGPVKEIVAKRFSRVALKSKPIETIDPANDTDLEQQNLFLKSMFTGITDDLTKKGLAKVDEYQEWVRIHCRVRTYTFQIRKCGNGQCCSPPSIPVDKLPWLPDPQLDESGDHYLPYEKVLGGETDDAHRPSAQPSGKLLKQHSKTSKEGTTLKIAQKRRHESTPSATSSLDPAQPIESQKDAHLYTTQNARLSLSCVECNKPRVLYSRHRLTERQQTTLTMIISEYEFTCGSPVVPPNHILSDVVLLRQPMNCGDPIEKSYYASGFGPVDICPYCAAEDVPPQPELRKSFKTVHPACEKCLVKGLNHICSLPYGKH